MCKASENTLIHCSLFGLASTKVAPCGLATGLDIGLSNLSLKTITLSFYSRSRRLSNVQNCTELVLP